MSTTTRPPEQLRRRPTPSLPQSEVALLRQLLVAEMVRDLARRWRWPKPKERAARS